MLTEYLQNTVKKWINIYATELPNMAAQTVFPMGLVMFSSTVGMPMGEDAQGLAEISHNAMPAPQLVMLANVACENPIEGKEMVELQTVGCTSYSDSEDENIIRYSYDSHEREMCIVDYPESPRATLSQAEEAEEEGVDLSKPSVQPPVSPSTPLTPSTPTTPSTPASPVGKMESAKKKKPFFCKACRYQAKCEQEFVTHIKIHSANRMMVVKRVEGDKSRPTEVFAGPPQEEAAEGGGGGEGGTVNKGVIRCERCGYNTNRYDHYMAHLKHHKREGDDQSIYRCTICTYTTVSQYHWRKHLRNHFPSKLFTCSQCCYFSDRKNNYVQHIRTHTGERPFRCAYCEYSSSQKTHLTRHMRTHSGERPFKCDSCNYLASNQHEVTRHARQVHNGPKPLCCPYCTYKTADRSNYKKHVELHLNPRQFLCPVCKYAASKKCNLQYHIKSRHPGCPQIGMDVSKIKLRVKKPGSDEFSDEYAVNESANVDDDEDDLDAEVGPAGADKQSSPINLSTKKSNPSVIKAAESVATDKTNRQSELAPVKETKKSSKPNPVQTVEGMVADKSSKKVSIFPVKDVKKSSKSNPIQTVESMPIDKNLQKCDVVPTKETPKKTKVSLKRKNMDMACASTKDNVTLKEIGKEMAAAVPRKQTILKTSVKDKTEMKETVAKVQNVNLGEDVDKDKFMEEKIEKDTLERDLETPMEEETKRPQKEKKEKLEKLRNDKETDNKNATKSLKTPKRIKKKVEKAPEIQEETAQSEKSKKKPVKRKAAEALDLSIKEYADEPCSKIKAKRLKVKAANKPHSKASITQSKTTQPCPAPEQEGPTNQTIDLPAVKKGRKSRTNNKKQAGHRETAGSSECSNAENPVCLTESEKAPSTELQPAVVEEEQHVADPEIVPALDTSSTPSVAEKQPNNGRDNVAQRSPFTSEVTTPLAEQAKITDKAEGTPALESFSGSNDSPVKTNGTPDFSQPLGEPSTPTTPSVELPRPQGKPTETEEDEGIHSHDGGSDISDSASEGSDDSGLNGLAGAAGKLANDPETPTEEVLTPTELKSHTCIFCDRTFLMEGEYRRHLNRHLVNVYYLDHAAKPN
ncbi:hypothetical protein UPYG_G00217700 [Umbra pygmaea]|uniref:C2H2-type domain-containing protein n=1 Tax=Umbra pygmaea TaxID=75934 RepID=A0ABD0WL49_UMBPY